MAALHPPDLDPGATDSVASSPRSEHYGSQDNRVRFMCSFNGKILPRPHDNQLRYVGGDTRIVAVNRSTTYSAFIAKLSKLSGIANLTVKYQLPNEDLDALISVTTDEDIENMIEEYDRILLNLNPRAARLRLFLFAKGEDSRASSISSLLDGSTNRENWFLDALNAGSRLERGRSEASSIVSEVPDYLFGLDNSDEVQIQLHNREPYKLKPRHNLNDNVSASDPGSPAPVVSSPYCSTSSAVATVPSIPDLPPVKTKLENPDPVPQQKQYHPHPHPHPHPVEHVSEPVEQPTPQVSGYPGNPVMHYVPNSQYSGQQVQQMPVYYVAGSVPPNNVPMQQVQIRAPYIQQYQVQTGQMPLGYHQQISGMGQVYGGAAMRPVNAVDPYDQSGRGFPEGMNQQVYYGVRNANPGPGMVAAYPGMVIQGGEDSQRTASDAKQGRISQS